MAVDIAIVGLAALAAYFDVRERRLPNLLTVGGLLLALALRVPLGLEALGMGVAGAAIGFGLALPFFLVGGLGGGDVKLLAAVGAFLGPVEIWLGLFVMAIVGGFMAVWVILRRGALRRTAANLHAIVAGFGLDSFRGWKGEGSPVTLETPGVLTVPYGVAIAVGLVAGRFL